MGQMGITTTTSTDLIFAIFPGYQRQFSDFGTEAGFHGTSFSSGISWYPRILGIYALHQVIHLLLLRTVLILFPGEYLSLSRAEISIRTGVVTRTRWGVTGAVCESWLLGWLALIGARAVC